MRNIKLKHPIMSALNEYLQRADRSQAWLSRQSGLPPSEVSRFLSHQRMPKLCHIYAMLKAIGKWEAVVAAIRRAILEPD